MLVWVFNEVETFQPGTENMFSSGEGGLQVLLVEFGAGKKLKSISG